MKVFCWRAILLASLLPALAACGLRLEEPEPANRVAAAAWREWRLFEGGTISYPGNGVAGRPMRVALTETQEPARSRIGEYWRLAGRPEWNGADTDRPWSGVFVSWVMAQAGVPASEFPRVGRHAQFLIAIDESALRSARPSFVLRDPESYRAKPGDLICRGSVANVMQIADRQLRHDAIDRYVTHCEVVIAIRPPWLRSIGGNVQDSVMLSSYPLDADARPLSPGQPWMLVVENRRY